MERISVDAVCPQSSVPQWSPSWRRGLDEGLSARHNAVHNMALGIPAHGFGPGARIVRAGRLL